MSSLKAYYSELIGFCMFGLMPENVLFINHTYIAPEWRGGGIYSGLVATLVEYCKDCGYKEILTCNHSDNTAMESVRRALGYKEVGKFYRLEIPKSNGAG